MTMRVDDWDMLGAAWRQTAGETSLRLTTEALQDTVRRRSRQLRWVVASEIVLTVVVLSGVVAALSSSRTRASALAAAGVVLWTVIVWTFAVWNRRGVWRPMSETTAEYVRLSRRRVEAGQRTLWFVRGSTLLYVLLYGPWCAYRVARESVSVEDAAQGAVAAAYGVGLVVWTLWYSRRLRQDLVRVNAIEAALALSDAA
ncbi:MAG: hypothetical protein U0163_13915 [Gemmatimonadaceae bacterium]